MAAGVYGCMRMTPKLKYALPIVQVTIGAWLVHLGYQQEWRLQRDADVAYVAPAWHLFDAITAPLRPLITSYRLVPIDTYPTLIALTAVAVWWFWTVRNASSLFTKSRVALPQWLPLRFVIDAILLLDGILCGYLGLGCLLWVCRYANWNPSRYSRLTPVEWMMELETGLCYVTWAIVLIMFFGRDVVQSIRMRTEANRSDLSPASSSGTIPN